MKKGIFLKRKEMTSNNENENENKRSNIFLGCHICKKRMGIVIVPLPELPNVLKDKYVTVYCADCIAQLNPEGWSYDPIPSEAELERGFKKLEEREKFWLDSGVIKLTKENN
ncbi:MAG: hypothetical protein WBL67_06820 [Nitrososphaeraceae archaeon]